MSNRESAARAIRELALATRAAARPSDHDRAFALCDYMTSFADAQETDPHWPIAAPSIASSRVLEQVAKFLEERIRDRACPALAEYERGVGTFEALDSAVRGTLDP